MKAPVIIVTLSALVVGPADGMTEVVWSGSFKRKNASDNPPEAESDEGAIKLIRGVYRGGLDNLKKMLEG